MKSKLRVKITGLVKALIKSMCMSLHIYVLTMSQMPPYSVAYAADFGGVCCNFLIARALRPITCSKRSLSQPKVTAVKKG
jgi:hypothetical protein